MKHALGLRADAGEFARLVAFAEEFARRIGLPDSERSRLLILLEELFTNAVRYGFCGRSIGWIEIVLAVHPESLEIEFSDDGNCFDPLAASLPAAAENEGGMGLEIVRALAHEARYRRVSGRNRLTLVRNLSRRR